MKLHPSQVPTDKLPPGKTIGKPTKKHPFIDVLQAVRETKKDKPVWYLQYRIKESNTYGNAMIFRVSGTAYANIVLSRKKTICISL